MTAILLYLPLLVGIITLWPGFCHETRPFYVGGFAPDQWLQRSLGRLRVAGKVGLWRKILPEIRGRPLINEFSSNARSKTRLLTASERCDQHFSSAIPRSELDSATFYYPETVPNQQISKIEPTTYASAH